jgi:hypothetical protein
MLAIFMSLIVIYMILLIVFIRQNHQMDKERLDKKRNYIGPEDEPEWTEYTRKFIS